MTDTPVPYDAVPADDAIRAHLETYYDLAPRGNADVEEVGPLTLFRSRGGYPYYGRPRLGGDDAVTSDDVVRLLDRQRELDVPRALEWVHETTPSLLASAEAAGMRVEICPLLVLEGAPVAREVEAEVRLVGPDDPGLPGVVASIGLGFEVGGTAVGEQGVAERDVVVAGSTSGVERTVAGLAAGRTVLVGAFVAGAGPVGGGSHNLRGATSEVVGVGVLPAFRRRGLAGAVAALLAADALERGATTVFCSAQNDDVARVYGAVGFRRVGTACIAEAD